MARDSFSRKTKKQSKKQASAPSSTSWARSLGGASIDTSGEFFNNLFVEENDFYKEQTYHHTPTSAQAKMPNSARCEMSFKKYIFNPHFSYKYGGYDL